MAIISTTVTAMKAWEPPSRPAGTRPASAPTRSSTKENSPICASVSDEPTTTGNGWRNASAAAPEPSTLMTTTASGEADDEEELVEQVAQIQQHPHRHEEGGREQDLQRQDVRQGLPGQARLADDQPGQERPERHADVGQARQIGGAEADADDGEQEHLGRTGPGHCVEQARHQRAGRRKHDDDDADRLGDRPTANSPHPSESPPSIGTTSTMATMARSWKIKNPNVTLPDGDAVVPLSARSFSTMAVELERDQEAGEQRRLPVDAEGDAQTHRERRW